MWPWPLQIRREAVARALLVASFAAAGTPLLPATVLGRPASAQLVAALAAVGGGGLSSDVETGGGVEVEAVS